MISTFKVNADMGLVTAMTISIALVLDFLLLPALLMAFDREKNPINQAHTSTGDSQDAKTIHVIEPNAV